MATLPAPARLPEKVPPFSVRTFPALMLRFEDPFAVPIVVLLSSVALAVEPESVPIFVTLALDTIVPPVRF